MFRENDFWKENDLDGSQGDLRAQGHPQRPRQAQPWGVQQVPFIFIKMNIRNMFHENDFRKGNNLNGSQGDLRALGHPQRPRQAQPCGVQQIPCIFIKHVSWTTSNVHFYEYKWYLLYSIWLNGWPCRSRWGRSRALRSPWDPSRSFSLRKSFMKHVSNVHFYEYKWYLLYSPWLSSSRLLRVS